MYYPHIKLEVIYVIILKSSIIKELQDPKRILRTLTSLKAITPAGVLSPSDLLNLFYHGLSKQIVHAFVSQHWKQSRHLAFPRHKYI